MNNLSVAIRTLSKRPGYGLSVVLTLALGIGASTMMFTLLDAAMLKPLPFSKPEQLVMLWGVAGPNRDIRGASFPEAADWRTMNSTLVDVSIYDEISLNMRLGNEAVRVDGEMVSASFFPLLGAEAALGRTFLPDEDRTPDAAPVAVISHALWRERFGGDHASVGRTIVLNDRTFTIVGVMPERFAGLSFDTDVWIPSMMVSLTSAPSVMQSRGNRWLGALARLRDGVSVARAQDDMTRVAALIEKDHPDYNRQRGVQVISVHESMLGTTGPLIVSLFAAVLLFLLVACANVAGLQLARTTARRRELAVRVALGARTWHLLKQLLTESLVLAAIAGTAGALLAAWGVSAAVALMPAGALPRHAAPSVDPRALAFAVFASITAGALIAVMPILSRRRDLSDVMKEGARSAAPGLGTLRRLSAPQVLVAGEIALAMTLLTAAGLMARSLERQLDVRLGFDAAGVTAARVTLPGARYLPEQRIAFVARLEERLKALPLIRTAAIGSDLPFTGNSSASMMLADAAPDLPVRYFRHLVTPDFLAALDIPLRSGRTFTPQDRQGTPLVAVISEAGAQRLWPGQDAVGKHFRLGGAPDAPSVEIIGVAGNARFRSLTSDLTSSRAEPDVYFPYAQRTDRELEIAIRSADGGTVPLPILQEVVASLDPGLPVYSVQRLEDAAARQTATARLGSVLLGLFSTGSLLLSAVALYGLVSYVVGLGRREIAIRIALGADARRVVALIVRNGMVLVAVGLAAGIVGALLAARALETQLFETPKADPLTFGGVATMLMLVSLVASLVPARRAVRVDPQIALRAE